MKKTTIVLRTLSLGLVCYSLGAGTVWAGDFQDIAVRAQRSLAQGIGVDSAPSLIRRSGSEPGKVADAILATVCNGGCTGLSRDDTLGVIAESPQVGLMVARDGSAVNFVDKSVTSVTYAGGRPESDAMSDSEILSLGNRYISDHLASLLGLGPGEAMIPLRTLHTRAGGRDARTDEALPTRVVSNEIVFGRTVNGLLVVGAGSKVRLSFGNDGRLRGFHYDWPSYEVKGQALPCVTIDKGLERLRIVLGALTGRASSAATGVNRTEGAVTFPTIVDGIGEVHDFQCGYFDTGGGSSAATDGRQIDTACEYSVMTGGAPMHGAVPMADSGFATSGWPEAQILTQF